jgi:DNA-binding GntR family transcriptional regulator
MTSDNVVVAARAYETIKSRIIDCSYPPGAKISEARLVDELGIGRSPIRTALARLRGEGWIEVNPQSGSYVKELSRQEMKDIFDFRILLETHVARLAAENITDEQLRKLKLGLRRVRLVEDDAYDQLMFEEFDAFDSFVHTTIYEAGGNAQIGSVLRNLLEKAQWLKKSTPSTPTRMNRWHTELARVIKALEARDPELAAQRIREHIGQAADFEMSFASRASKRAKAAKAE